MDSLLSQLNENVNDDVAESQNINAYFDILCEKTSISIIQLDEAITNWLARVRESAVNGNLDPNKKASVGAVLGALMAVSEPDLADALDEKGTLGTILAAAGDKDQATSNAALSKLRDMGLDPSVRTFTANATKALDDQSTVVQFINKIQSKIDRTMNQRLGMERKRQESKQPTGELARSAGL